MLSALHLVLALGSIAVSFATGMARWDSGKAGFIETLANSLGWVLLQPGSRLWGEGISGELDSAILLGNSVLWGALGALVVVGIARRKAKDGRINQAGE